MTALATERVPSRELLPRLTTRWRSLLPRERLIIGWAAIPAVLLFLVPLVFWTGFTGNRASVGGDASLLFFDYPAQWLHNSSTTLASPGGYNAQTQFVPLISVIRLLRLVDLNPQGILFGATLASGYLGTRWLLLELLDRSDRHIQPAAALAGSVYLSLPVSAEIIWAAPLPRLFWIALLPLFVACLLAHQRTGRRRNVAGAVAISVLLAPAATDFPGTIPAVILAVALIAISFLAGRRRPRLGRAAGFFGTVVAANLFWLIPTALSVNQGAQVADATSSNGVAAATGLVKALGPQQQPTAALELRQSHLMMIINNWIQLPIDDWSRYLSLLGLIPLVLVFAAAIHGRVRGGMLAALSLVTVVILGAQSTGAFPLTQPIYVYLTEHIPGWTAERNFFGTWPVTLSLAVALTIGTAFVRFCNPDRSAAAPGGAPAPLARADPARQEVLQVNKISLAAILLAVLMLLYDAPFFAGRVFRLNYTSAITVPRVIDGLPSDYLDAVSYIQRAPAGDVMTLPLLSPAWSIVPKGSSQGYVGLSPITFLTNRADYDGLDSFGSTTPSAVAIRAAVASGNSRGLARAVGAMGVRYVLVDTDLLTSSLFGLEATSSLPAEEALTTSLLHDHAAQILATFGPWQVRALNAATIRDPIEGVTFPLDSNYSTPIADFAGSTDAGLGSVQTGTEPCSNIDVTGSSEHEVVVHARAVLPACALFLNRPYSPKWQARITTAAGSRSLPVIRSNAALTAFVLPAGTQPGATVTIRFGPNNRLADWVYLSIVVPLVIALLSFFSRRRRLFSERRTLFRRG